MATSYFPHLHPGQAMSSRTAAWPTVTVEGVPHASSPRSVNFSKVQACGGSAAGNTVKSLNFFSSQKDEKLKKQD